MSIWTVENDLNMTSYENNPFALEDHSIDISMNNKSMIESPQKKIRAGRSVWADRAKSRQFRDTSQDVPNQIGYEVDLNELSKPPPLLYEVHGEPET